MRAAAIILVLVCGCGGPPSRPENLQPYVAAFGQHGVLEAVAGPTPAPTPSGKCTNCNGKGSVSDGRVSVKCPVCDGRGVVGAATECKTGTCGWPPRSILR